MLTHAFSYTDPLPILDEEFDKVDITASLAERTSVGSTPLGDDLAWDDQLDNGDEMSL